MTSAAAPRLSFGMRTAGLRAVFERDFLVFTSRPRFLVLRTLSVALPAAILLVLLGTTASRTSFGTSRVGQTVMTMSSVVLPALVMLLAPVLAASSIAAERALNTLDIVLATPVAPWAFVVAKFLSRLAIVLVLVCATLPLAGVAFLYGGVSPALFLELVAFILAIAVLGTAGGLVASAWSGNVARAAIAGYLLPVVLPLIHLLVAFSVLNRRGGGPPTDEYGLELNLFYAWGRLLEGGIGLGTTVTHPGWTVLAWSSALAALAVGAAAWRMSREAAHQVARRAGFRKSRPVRWSNPVLDRSLRGTAFDRPRLGTVLRLGFVIALTAIIPVLAGYHGDLDEEWPHIAVLSVVAVVTPLFAMVTAAHGIASERESGSFDLLLATRLSPSDIVYGKFTATLLSVAPLPLLALVYAVLFSIAVDGFGPVTILAWLVSMTIVTGFVTAVATWASAGAATAARAVLWSFGLVIGGAIVHGVLMMLVMMMWHRVLDDAAIYLFGGSPGFVGGALIPLSMDNHWNNEEWHVMVSWLLWATIYVVATIVLLRLTVRTLRARNETR